MLRIRHLPVVVLLLVGVGFQAPLAAQCIGDCNGNGSVSIDELVAGIRVALSEAPQSSCPAYVETVSIDQIISAVGNALRGCPPTPTPTSVPATSTVATPTIGATATNTPFPPSPTSAAIPTRTPTAAPTPSRTPSSGGLTTLSSSSPAAGEQGVAVTRETILRFSGALSRNSIAGAAIFATFGGESLAARLHVSPEANTVTLFYDANLPGSARVRVTVDGEHLRDAAGNPVDADGDGQPGGVALIDFDTLNVEPAQGTFVCGRVFASELAASGRCTQDEVIRCATDAECGTGNRCIGQCADEPDVECASDLDCGEGDRCEKTSMNVPLAGVTITVDGREDEIFAVTNELGNFRLENVPAGVFFVHIDGRTARNDAPSGTSFLDGRTARNDVPEGAYYPFVGKAWESVRNRETNVGNVFLPLVTGGTLTELPAGEDMMIEFPDDVLADFPHLDGTFIMVPADSLFADDGTLGGMIGIAPVPPDRLPGALPEGLEFPIVITVQTNGPTNFDRPVAVCFPNLPDPRTGELLPPGAESALWSFNHDTGRFEIVGSMHVTEDGRLICTDPGVGILAPGWHGSRPGTTAGGTQPRDGGDRASRTMANATAAQECSNDDCPCDGSCETNHAVLLHSGEERFERTDLVIPGRGDIHFAMRRRYRSALDYDGPLGHAWDFSYNDGLYRDPDGSMTRVNGGSHIDQWKREDDGSFTAPTGHFRDLVERDDGTFVLRSPDGFQRLYDTDGRLFAYQDRYGNTMLFHYDPRGNLDRIIDAYGREIDFQFETFPDGVARLVRITDFHGRAVEYRYDDRGDLVEVRSPLVSGTSTGNDFPNGRIERYEYSSGFANDELNHNLLRVFMPEEVAGGGPSTYEWTYGEDPDDPLTFDKVLAERKGGTNASGVPAGGTTTFVYETLNEDEPAGQPHLPRGKVLIMERNGNQLEYFVDELKHHIITRQLTRGLREGEPDSYETLSFYDEDGLLVRRVFPEGNEIHYVYDSDGPRGQQQNVIEQRRVAGPRGGGEDLVTTFEYEPLYNRIASMTDPRGNASGFEPPIGEASAERYTTRFFYDYQESNDPVELADFFGIDLSAAARGLGDLNADGRTDQTFGNLVRAEAPSVELLPDSNEAARLGSTVQDVVSEIQWNDRGQQIAAIDPEGNVTDVLYHPENDPDGDGRRTLDVFRPLSAEPTGYRQATIVDSRDSPRRSATAPPAALETAYLYDPVGNVIGVRDPRGILSRIEVNQLNEPVAVTRGAEVSDAIASGQLLLDDPPFRYRSRLFYDHNGRVVRTETENRDSTTEGVGEFVDHTVTYDIVDNPVETTVEVDAETVLTTTYRYDESELPISIMRPEGNRSETAYDERNLPFMITRGAGSPGASTVRIDYDRNGNRLRVTDAEDNDGDGEPESMSYAYDGFDRPTQVIDALGNRSVNDYDVNSNVVRRRALGHPAGQPDGESVDLQDHFVRHDELNRPYQVDARLFLSEGFDPVRAIDLRDDNSDGFVTARFEFDALSRRTFVVEDDLEVTQTVYDGASRAIEAIDQVGNRALTEYDQSSNPVAVTSVEVSPEGLVPEEAFTTRYVWDQLDRLARVTDNSGQTTRFAYDSRDNLVSRSDPEGAPASDPLNLFPAEINAPGNTMTYLHDGLDRVLAEVHDLRVGGVGGGPIDTSNPTNPDGRVTVAYAWDGNSRLAGITDDNGNRTSFAYDELDRRVMQINADGKTHTYAYDRDNNLRQIVNPNGSVIARDHDALNRLVHVDVERAVGVLGTTRVTYEHDGLSRQTRSTDDNGSTETLQTVERVYDSLSRLLEERQNGEAVSTVWSGDGKRLSCTYPGGRTITQTFDEIDRVKAVADASGPIAESSWIGPGYRELHRVNGNGTTFTFLNDDGDEDIGYDAVKRIVRLRGLLPDGVTAFLDREYGYNRADMRTFERRNDDFGLTDAYTYDSLYRIVRTELDTAGSGGMPRDLVQTNYQLDGAGNRRKLDQVRETLGMTSLTHAVDEMNEYTSIDGVAQANDDNGNLTDDGSRLFSFDYRNRLVAIRDKASGMPVAEYLYLADNRRSRKNVHMPTAKDVAFFYDGWQVCEERDVSSDDTEVTYVWSPVYIDELVQMQRTAAHPLGAEELYAHQNARADVVALTSSDGVLVESFVYDDFGNPNRISSSGNPYLFQGRRFDEESGLYYFRNRYYDPARGRFIQRDPKHDRKNVGNPYTFAGSAPASDHDPMGFLSLSVVQTQSASVTRPGRPSLPRECFDTQEEYQEDLKAYEIEQEELRKLAEQEAIEKLLTPILSRYMKEYGASTATFERDENGCLRGVAYFEKDGFRIAKSEWDECGRQLGVSYLPGYYVRNSLRAEREQLKEITGEKVGIAGHLGEGSEGSFVQTVRIESDGCETVMTFDQRGYLVSRQRNWK